MRIRVRVSVRGLVLDIKPHFRFRVRVTVEVWVGVPPATCLEVLVRRVLGVA